MRKAREEQGLSISDIEKGTNIRSLYITAIEEGNYDALPGAVYVKGFVRNYAKFLGLDADECVLAYQSEASGKPSNPDESKAKNNTPQKSTSNMASGRDYHNRVDDMPRRQNLALIGLMAVIIVVGGWVAFGDSFSTPDSIKAETNKPAVTSQKPGNTVPQHKDSAFSTHPQKETTASMPQHKEPAVSTNEGVSIAAHLHGKSWMSVTVDGKNVFEGIAEDGETMTWTGEDSIIISTGNAGAVEITQNGKSLGTMGGAGEVIDRTYSNHVTATHSEITGTTANITDSRHESAAHNE